MRNVVGFVVVAIGCSFCLVTDLRGQDKPETGILGAWKMIEIQEGGNKMPPPVEMIFTFDKETLEQKIAGRSRKSQYKIDTTKDPMQLDLVQELAGQKREFKMLFVLDGDTLKICSKRANNERPTAFESKDGASITVFQRMK
jgi:uncharacterized protein (TIGR03067 family)